MCGGNDGRRGGGVARSREMGDACMHERGKGSTKNRCGGEEVGSARLVFELEEARQEAGGRRQESRRR